MLKKISDFILFSSLFIAICAVALAAETCILLHLPLNKPSFYLFIFGATLAQYNLHYLVKTSAVAGSERLAWSLAHKEWHRVMFLIGCGFVIYSLFQFRLHHFYILIILGATAFLYSFPVIPFFSKKRIKDFGRLKILTLALLWTLVTVWFPASDASPEPVSYALVFVMRFVFMFVLCLLFDIRDIAIDNAENINTLPVMLGVARSYRLADFILGVFVLLSLFQFVYTKSFGVFLAMLLSAIIAWLVTRRTKKTNADAVYLAGVDGLMFLQALLVLLVQ